VQFTRPGHPEDNGSHEQWHRVLKAETTRPPARHYYRSRVRYVGSRSPRYPAQVPVRRVHNGGEIKWQGRFRFIGEAFAGYLVALKPHRRGVWKVYFYHVLLGHLHDADTSGIRTASHQHSSKGPRKV
jgi:hypothetical protein